MQTVISAQGFRQSQLCSHSFLVYGIKTQKQTNSCCQFAVSINVMDQYKQYLIKSKERNEKHKSYI